MKMELRKEINKILENTILPEGISNEEMKNPDTVRVLFSKQLREVLRTFLLQLRINPEMNLHTASALPTSVIFYPILR